MPEPFHLWDGLFHASTFIFTVLGLWILWRYSRPNHWDKPQALAFRRLQGREQCLCLVLWDRRRGFDRRCWRQQEKLGPTDCKEKRGSTQPDLQCKSLVHGDERSRMAPRLLSTAEPSHSWPMGSPGLL